MLTKRKFLESNMQDVKVFFACVAEEMKAYKDNLVKELENYGCVVLNAEDCVENIENTRDIIEQCEVAIHILSDRDYGINSSGKGIEESQIHYSVQHLLSQKLISEASESDFRIYAWHPRSNSQDIYEEERIPTHLKKIQQLDEVDLLRTNFEDFKVYLVKKIEEDYEEEVDEFYIKGSNREGIYFLYDSSDQTQAEEYIEYLSKRGYTVFTPMFDNDIMAVRQMHTNCLKKFDIAIIFSDKASINWVNMKIMDILKSPGLGREKPIIGKAVFIPDQKIDSLPSMCRGFEIVAINKGSIKDQIEGFLRNLTF